MAKLVTRLLAMAALWVRIQTPLKNLKQAPKIQKIASLKAELEMKI
jgi:hypothetical protein